MLPFFLNELMLLGLVFCVCFFFCKINFEKKMLLVMFAAHLKQLLALQCVTYLNVPDKKQIISLQNLAAIEPDI